MLRAGSKGKSRRRLAASRGDEGENSAKPERGLKRANSKGKSRMKLVEDDSENNAKGSSVENEKSANDDDKEKARARSRERRAMRRSKAESKKDDGGKPHGEDNASKNDTPTAKFSLDDNLKRAEKQSRQNEKPGEAKPADEASVVSLFTSLKNRRHEKKFAGGPIAKKVDDSNPANALLSHLGTNYQDLISISEAREKEEDMKKAETIDTSSKHGPASVVESTPKTDSIDWRPTKEDTAEVDAFFKSWKGKRSKSSDKSGASDTLKTGRRGILSKTKSLATGLSDRRKIKKAKSAWNMVQGDDCSLEEEELAPPSLAGDLEDRRKDADKKRRVRRVKSNPDELFDACKSLAPPSVTEDEAKESKKLKRKSKKAKDEDDTSLAPPSLAGDLPKIDSKKKKRAKKYQTIEGDDCSVDEIGVIEEEPQPKSKRRSGKPFRSKSTSDKSLGRPSLAGDGLPARRLRKSKSSSKLSRSKDDDDEAAKGERRTLRRLARKATSMRHL